MSTKTKIALAAALIVGTASAALASDNSGEYKGGALFGPTPGQVFHYARPGVPGAGAFAYVPGHGRVVVRAPNLRAEYPTAPWDEY
jgi:hypothetical protein